VQLLMLHTPTVHFAEPPVVSQTWPQPPQLLTFLLVSVSQPLAGPLTALSQSEKPPMHVMRHCELAHDGVPLMAEHTEPQAPQLAASVVVFTSQPLLGSPSQSAKGAVQVSTAHFPPLHKAEAWGKSQGASQAPQWSASVFRFVSQPLAVSPSQLPLPSRQLSEQTLLVQSPPAQSVGSLQCWPGKQVGHAPPQSTSVSSPF